MKMNLKSSSLIRVYAAAAFALVGVPADAALITTTTPGEVIVTYEGGSQSRPVVFGADLGQWGQWGTCIGNSVGDWPGPILFSSSRFYYGDNPSGGNWPYNVDGNSVPEIGSEGWHTAELVGKTASLGFRPAGSGLDFFLQNRFTQPSLWYESTAYSREMTGWPGTYSYVSRHVWADVDGSLGLGGPQGWGSIVEQVGPNDWRLHLDDCSDTYNISSDSDSAYLIRITVVPVPEPSTILAGFLLCIPLGVSGIRCLRNRNKLP